jgi:oligopeptide transport system ATP-binding protein
VAAVTSAAQSDAPPRDGDARGARLLEVADLSVEFRLRDGVVVQAANEVSYAVDRGETLAVLGESGSGKTVSARAVLGLLPTPPAVVTGGKALFAGRDLLALSPSERRGICGTRIAMVFQDALAALNPVFTIGYQLAELFRVHRGASKRQAWAAAAEQLERVGIPAAATRLHDYPHQFSGGMRQRVMIAMAIALEPDVLIADEPTTALDVTVQAQIIELLDTLKRDGEMGLILITHDLGVVAESANRVVVMYAGRVVETGPVRDVLRAPAHPYTQGLLRAMPRARGKGMLTPISGTPPRLSALPPGCAFRPRCPRAEERCASERPRLRPLSEDRASACHFAEELLGA